MAKKHEPISIPIQEEDGNGVENVRGIHPEVVRKEKTRANIERALRAATSDIDRLLKTTSDHEESKAPWNGKVEDIQELRAVERDGVMVQLGKYDIEEKIGSGATSEVYYAFDNYTPVAIKAIDITGEKHHLERAIQEAQILLNHSHPNIAKLVDIARSGEKLYLVMEHQPYNLKTFSDSLRDLKPDKKEKVWLRVAIEISEALSQIHKKHLHRDIKPENVLVTDDGKPILTDFGAARLIAEPNQFESEKSGFQIVGTAAFAPPEVLAEEAATVKAEVFSLAATIYESITGESPIKEESMGLMNLVKTAGDLAGSWSYLKRRQYNNRLKKNLQVFINDSELIQVIVRALEPRKNKRPSLKEFQQALTKIENRVVNSIDESQRLLRNATKALRESEQMRNQWIKSTQSARNPFVDERDLNMPKENSYSAVRDPRDAENDDAVKSYESDDGLDIRGVEDSQADAREVNWGDTAEIDPGIVSKTDLKSPYQTQGEDSGDDLQIVEDYLEQDEQDEEEEEPIDPYQALEIIEEELESNIDRLVLQKQINRLKNGDRIQRKNGQVLAVVGRSRDGVALRDVTSPRDGHTFLVRIDSLEKRYYQIHHITADTSLSSGLEVYLQQPKTGDQIQTKNGKLFVVTSVNNDEMVIRSVRPDKSLGKERPMSVEKLMELSDQILDYVPAFEEKKEPEMPSIIEAPFQQGNILDATIDGYRISFKIKKPIAPDGGWNMNWVAIDHADPRELKRMKSKLFKTIQNEQQKNGIISKGPYKLMIDYVGSMLYVSTKIQGQDQDVAKIPIGSVDNISEPKKRTAQQLPRKKARKAS